MECNDPWKAGSGSEINIDTFSDHFEDNFITKNSEKLPDSDEYLATLEKKLAKITGVKGKANKREGKDLIKSLEERSDSCMYRLIAGDSYTLTDQDLALDAPAQLSLSSKWLNPEQAITVGELVELVKADYLANQQTEEAAKEENN